MAHSFSPGSSCIRALWLRWTSAQRPERSCSIEHLLNLLFAAFYASLRCRGISCIAVFESLFVSELAWALQYGSTGLTRLWWPQAVTAGSDGALMVLPLDSPAGAQSIMQPRSSASYAAVCWSSPQAFVSAGTSGSTSPCAVAKALLSLCSDLHPLACSRALCWRVCCTPAACYGLCVHWARTGCSSLISLVLASSDKAICQI